MDFNLDTWWWWWWWSLSLHCTLLLALPSYKSLRVSGRFSQRSTNWKLSLISWIKFAVCYEKGNQCCRNFSSSNIWYPLHRKEVWLQNWNRSLWELYLDLSLANGRTYERKKHRNCSSLSDFYTHHVMPAKSRKQNNSKLGRTWKWQSTCSFNVCKVFCSITCNSATDTSWH